MQVLAVVEVKDVAPLVGVRDHLDLNLQPDGTPAAKPAEPVAYVRFGDGEGAVQDADVALIANLDGNALRRAAYANLTQQIADRSSGDVCNFSHQFYIAHLTHENERILTLALLTPLLAASYQRAFAARFFWRSRSWPVAAGNCQDFSKIIVSGFLNEVLGIGQAGRLTAAALAGAGLQVIQEDLRPLDRHLLTAAPVDLPYAPVWLIHANPPEARIALFRHRHATWARTYRIGYWVWESSVAPYEWTDLARWFHSIWTPSGSSYDALVEAFRRAGRSDQIGKLRIVPHPVTVPSARSRSAGPVQALCLFDPRSDFDRKNPEGAVEAWLRAFPKPGQPRLVIKTLAQAAGHPRLSAVRGLAAQRGDIEICAETLDAVATEELVSRSHILLSLHRAEGFGLPLAEAMAHGLTVIATGWSGNMQFMTPNNALLVPYRLAAANANYNGPQAKWAEPDVDAAAVALRQAVGDASLRTRLGKRARADIEVLSRGWTHDALFL